MAADLTEGEVVGRELVALALGARALGVVGDLLGGGRVRVSLLSLSGANHGKNAHHIVRRTARVGRRISRNQLRSAGNLMPDI